jgi:hypothetical protein
MVGGELKVDPHLKTLSTSEVEDHEQRGNSLEAHLLLNQLS